MKIWHFCSWDWEHDWETAERCSENFHRKTWWGVGGVNEGLDRYSHLHESLQGLRWKERERAEEEERRRPGRAAAAVEVYKQAKWSHTDGRTHTEGRLWSRGGGRDCWESVVGNLAWGDGVWITSVSGCELDAPNLCERENPEEGEIQKEKKTTNPK